MGGRPPKHSDTEVLELFIASSDPFLFTTEVAEMLDMTQQGAHARLSSLTEKGYIRSKKTENARGWWITHAGREFAVSNNAD